MLSKLLKAKEPLFSRAIKQLEDHTHKQGIDAALMAEIIQKAHTAMRTLGLDPADTTGKELYHALMNRVKSDNERLATAIGGKDPNNLEEMIPLIKARVEQIDMPRDCWVLKDDVAKRMLVHMPPKNILKRLNYESVKQMLKNESLYEIYGALRFAEDGEWLNTFNEQYKSLTPDDFETRQIQVVTFDARKWGDLAEHFIEKKLHNITHLKELGVIITMPVAPGSKMTGQGITLKVFPLILHYFNEIRLYSAFFKLMQTKNNFGEIVVDTLIADIPKTSVTEDKYIDWRVIQRYYGKLVDEGHPEVMEPHVQPEDLHWRKAEEILYGVDSELQFWQDMDYVGLIINDDTVTFNLMDVALSYANRVEYKQRYIYHFRESLWNEVFIRYLGQKNLEERILMRLDNEMIQPEQIPVSNK